MTTTTLIVLTIVGASLFLMVAYVFLLDNKKAIYNGTPHKLGPDDNTPIEPVEPEIFPTKGLSLDTSGAQSTADSKAIRLPKSIEIKRRRRSSVSKSSRGGGLDMEEAIDVDAVEVIAELAIDAVALREAAAMTESPAREVSSGYDDGDSDSGGSSCGSSCGGED